MRTLVFGCALVAVLATVVEARVWTAADGSQQVEAEFVGVKDGQVRLRKPDGNIATVPLQFLCAQDQEFINNGGEERAPQQPAISEPVAGEGDQSSPERFDEAIRNNPNDPNAYYARALARTNKDMPEQAMADLQKAIQLDPTHAAAHDARGSLHKKMGDAARAHEDFDKAIELNPELASAYKHRGENLSAFYKTPEGKVGLSEELEKFRKKYHAVAGNNRRKTPWQPLNNTTGNVSGAAAVMQLAKLDFDRARELEAYRPGRDWGHDGGHGGCGCGHGPGCGCGCPGPGPAPKAIVTDPALQIYPEQIVRGDTITLVANPAALSRGLIHKAGVNEPFPDKVGVYAPNARLPKSGVPTAKDVERVDFYRDVDKDNMLDAEMDQLLGSDATADDGYMLEVASDDIPPGNQSFFAVPRGGECPCEEGEDDEERLAELIDLADMLERAALQETDLHDNACEACEAEGLDAELTEALAQEQDVVADVADEVMEKIADSHPLVAELLGEAEEPIDGAAEQLAKAGEAPGEPSKEPGSKAAENAKKAGELLQEAADMLRDAAENPVEDPAAAAAKAEPAQGVPASAQAEITMGEGAPAPGPGPGPGGPGSGGPGSGGDCDDCDDDLYVDDDDIDFEDERAEEAIERALGFIDDEDYDSAVVEYDRLVEDYPDNYVYLRRRAGVNLLRGGYDYAISDYDRLIGTHANRADLYYNRGCAHLAAGRLEDAFGDFTKSVELNETWNLAWNNRGTTLARMERYQEAVYDFTKALEINPNDHLAYKNRALAYKKMGKVELAEADFAEMKRLQPVE